MRTDKIRKYILPNLPYLLVGWAFLKIGTAYRMVAGADLGAKLLGTLKTIGPAFADLAPGIHPFDWLVGLVGAVLFRLFIYQTVKKAKPRSITQEAAIKENRKKLTKSKRRREEISGLIKKLYETLTRRRLPPCPPASPLTQDRE